MLVPDRYAVFGNPIAHSLSPIIHTNFAKQTHQFIGYEKILVPLDKFKETVHAFFLNGGRGLNITLPFKLEAFELCEELTDRAHNAKAVNTIKFNLGKILGDNTDGIGLVRDIQQNHHIPLQNKSILLLGSGGAARGAILALVQLNPSKLIIANRTATKAIELAKEFALEGRGFSELENDSYDIIINATSASLYGESIPLKGSVIRQDSFCYDMFYTKKTIPFLQWAQERGAKTADGLGMLVEQAAESFYLWRNIMPDTKPVIQLLRKHLQL